MRTPTRQARDHILFVCLPLVQAKHTEIVIPCYARDEADYKAALELSEVKKEIARIGIAVRLLVVDRPPAPGPNSLIAPIEGIFDGTLDRYMRRYDK